MAISFLVNIFTILSIVLDFFLSFQLFHSTIWENILVQRRSIRSSWKDHSEDLLHTVRGFNLYYYGGVMPFAKQAPLFLLNALIFNWMHPRIEWTQSITTHTFIWRSTPSTIAFNHTVIGLDEERIEFALSCYYIHVKEQLVKRLSLNGWAKLLIDRANVWWAYAKPNAVWNEAIGYWQSQATLKRANSRFLETFTTIAD